MDDSGNDTLCTTRWLLRIKESGCGFILVFCVLYLWAGLFTLPDYGLTWDETWENYYGDKSLGYYFSFDRRSLDFRADTVGVYKNADHPDWHWATGVFKDNDLYQKPYLIWPVGAMLSSVCKYIAYAWVGIYDPVTAHHLAPLLGALALMIGLYFFVRRQFGDWQATIAVIVVAVHPRFYAHAHFNSKDILCAAFFAFTVFLFHDGVARKKPKLILWSAVIWGVGLATKPNGLFLAFVLGPYLLAALLERRRKGEKWLEKAEIGALAAFMPIGFACMFACWPLLWLDFPSNVTAYIASLRTRGFSGDTSSWNAWPVCYAFATMPLGIMALALSSVFSVFRQKLWRRPIFVLLAAWLIVPVLRVCMPGAKDFDGIRHWLEFIPVLAIFCGIGGGGLVEVISNRLNQGGWSKQRIAVVSSVLIAAFFLPTVCWLVKEHPNQIGYFNPVVGRLAGAQKKGYPDATDYWGSSYRQGFDWLNQNVAAEQPILLVGVAEHIAYYTYEVWLDRRIMLRSCQQLTAQQIKKQTGPVYLMFVTRKGWQHQLVKQFAKAPVVHEIKVDGGVILRIQRLR